MRISDWSSDVCSSDLSSRTPWIRTRFRNETDLCVIRDAHNVIPVLLAILLHGLIFADMFVALDFWQPVLPSTPLALRSEERRVGNGCVRACSETWSAYRLQIKKK